MAETQPTRRGLPREEATLLAMVATLVALGLVMIYSTSAVRADVSTGDHTFFLRKQLLWVALSTLMVVLVGSADPRWLRRMVPWILAGNVLLLLAVFIPGIGVHVRGASRWLSIAGLRCQPSEIAKFTIVLCTAFLATRPEAPLQDFRRGFLPAFGLVCAMVLLVAAEPDLGTAAFIGVVGTTVLVVGGLRLAHLLPIALPLGGIAVVVAATRFDHVRQRLLAFLEPEANAQGASYQVRQSLLALGSGGPLGMGLGDGRQKWLFLPDEHTDFILAILGEELGFLGCGLVVGLFLCLLIQGSRILLRCQDRFAFLVVFGVCFTIGLQAVMNIAVVTASMPTKGISLPFVSYGGSNLFACALGVGLVLCFSRYREITEDMPTTQGATP